MMIAITGAAASFNSLMRLPIAPSFSSLNLRINICCWTSNFDITFLLSMYFFEFRHHVADRPHSALRYFTVFASSHFLLGECWITAGLESVRPVLTTLHVSNGVCGHLNYRVHWRTACIIHSIRGPARISSQSVGRDVEAQAKRPGRC